MLLRLHNRNGRTMLLKTDEAGEDLRIIENKTNSIKENFFLKWCLDLGLLHVSSGNFFLNNFLKIF